MNIALLGLPVAAVETSPSPTPSLLLLGIESRLLMPSLNNVNGRHSYNSATNARILPVSQLRAMKQIERARLQQQRKEQKE
jgi:hypothetical protein